MSATIASCLERAEQGLSRAQRIADQRKAARQAQERAARRRASQLRKASRDKPDDSAARAEADDAEDTRAELARHHAELQRDDDQRVAEAAAELELWRFEAAVDAWQKRWYELEPCQVLVMGPATAGAPSGARTARREPDGRPAFADPRLTALAGDDFELLAALHLQAAGTPIPERWARAHGVPHAPQQQLPGPDPS